VIENAALFGRMTTSSVQWPEIPTIVSRAAGRAGSTAAALTYLPSETLGRC
jgi:hypothetical protein